MHAITAAAAWDHCRGSLGPHCAHIGITLEWFRDRAGSSLGLCWCHPGITSGSLWDHIVVNSRSFWDWDSTVTISGHWVHLDIILEAFWKYFDIILETCLVSICNQSGPVVSADLKLAATPARDMFGNWKFCKTFLLLENNFMLSSEIF